MTASSLKCTSPTTISLLLLFFVPPITPINFLLFLIGTSQHERATFEFLAQELARRSHRVVSVKPILVPEEPRLVKPILHMVNEKVLKDVLPPRLYTPLDRVWEDVPWRRAYEPEAHREPYWAAHRFACQQMLNSNLRETLAREQPELAIVYAGNPCQLGFVHSLGIPFVLVDLDGLTPETMVAAGAGWDLPPPSGTSFFDGLLLILARLSRTFSLAKESLVQSGIPPLASALSASYRQMDQPIWAQFQGDPELKRKFPKGFPELNMIRRRAELFLANTDPLLESPTLALPSRLLPIGGVHIDAVRPLFSPWNESIANAEHGVILVSLGMHANTSAMPEELVHSFLHAFRHLSGYRIFWRISPKLTLPGMNDTAAVPPHLNITSFFPQNELLAHPRTRLLITNGGIHSLMEALHWGVPLLGIPLFGQNMANMEKVEARGLGTWLEKNEARDGQKLLAAIKRVLYTPRFAKRAKQLGAQIRSRPASAFERTFHALEWAARRPTRRRHDAPSPLLSLLLFHLRIDLLLAFAALLAIFCWTARELAKLAGLCCFCWPTTTALANWRGRKRAAAGMKEE